MPAAGYRVRRRSTRVRCSARSRSRRAKAPSWPRSRRSARAARSSSGADVVVGHRRLRERARRSSPARRARVPLVLHRAERRSRGSRTGSLARVGRASWRLRSTDARPRFRRGARVERHRQPGPRRDRSRCRPTRAALAAEALRGARTSTPDRRTVVVFGGSQGALHLDQAVAGRDRALRDRADLQLLVLTGPGHERRGRGRARPRRRSARVRVVAFLDRMELALAVADLAVARAGATHIAELARLRRPVDPRPVPARDREPSGGERPRARARGSGARSARRRPDGGRSRGRASSSCSTTTLDAARDGASGARAWARPDAAERLAALVAGGRAG